MMDENQADFAFSKSDKINDAWILTNHVRALLNDMRTNPAAFVSGVNGLEDWLDATGNAIYQKALKEQVTAPFNAEVAKIAGSADSEDRMNVLIFNKARGKFRLLRRLVEKDGLMRERTGVLDEGFDIAEDDTESDDTNDEDDEKDDEVPAPKKRGRPFKEKNVNL